MARILGIDYGTKRIGFAVTDPLQIIVSPLAVIAAEEAIPYLMDYVAKEEVELLVLGMPGEAYEKTRSALKEFVGKMRKVLPQVPIVYQDEHLTSRKASEIILQSGARKMQRRDKGLVDQVSAVLILQEYLGHLKDVQIP